jgi:hypothetical protein
VFPGFSRFIPVLSGFFVSGKMEFSKLEQEAEKKAANHVANMLHTPDKLEKVRKSF